MSTTITRTTAVEPTARLRQMSALFDLEVPTASTVEWPVPELDLPSDWHVGVFYGPSGSGKSTLAREMFPDAAVNDGSGVFRWTWPRDRSIVDGFPNTMSVKDVAALLSSVGFSSPPAWQRPHGVLSNGQKFRCDLARTVAEAIAEKPLAGPDGPAPTKLVDEFTSVVDRNAARIGSAAVAKAVRRYGVRLVLCSCHDDVLEWLEPDWVYDVATNQLLLNEVSNGEGQPPGKPQADGSTGDAGADRRSSWRSVARPERHGSSFVSITI